MNKVILTKAQRKLFDEINYIIEICELDHKKVDEVKPEWRTIYLKHIKDHLIRSEVIIRYTLIDEALSTIICDYFYGKGKNSIKLWRTKKYQNFNYFVLDELYLTQKIPLVNKILKIHGHINEAMYRINGLRNSLAHSFFPENRLKKPTYKGKDVYSIEGFTLILKDSSEVNKYFFKKIFSNKIHRSLMP